VVVGGVVLAFLGVPIRPGSKVGDGSHLFKHRVDGRGGRRLTPKTNAG
jgi:hypothetical protein